MEAQMLQRIAIALEKIAALMEAEAEHKRMERTKAAYKNMGKKT